MSPGPPSDRHNDVTATTLPQLPSPAALAIEEFDARNWRKDELVALARTLGIPSWGKKPALLARVRKRLTALRARDERADTVSPAAAPLAADATAQRDEPLTAAQSAPSALARPQFFREVPGQTRSQALAAWYASRKAQAGGQGQ